jgi:hypothetical protein
MWVSQQEEVNELTVATGGHAVSSNNEQEVKFTTLEFTKTGAGKDKQDEQHMPIVADNLMQRSPDNDVPKNIFTPFLATQNNPDINVPPAMTPPENPFIYAGKIVDEGALVIFLIDGEKSHAVKSGDVIEDTWKIKSIMPPTMTLKYIPLKVEMQMEIGANS